MPTATKVFDRASVYHSQLVTATREPLSVKLGQVRPSKFKKGTFTVALNVHGDETTYWYQIENETIKDYLEGLARDEKGDTAWLAIRATGTREDADVVCEDMNGQLVTPAMPPTTNKQPNGPPENIWEEELKQPPAMSQTQRIQEASFSDPLAARYLGALEAARLAVTEYSKRHGQEPSEAIRNVATTMFIQNGRGH